VLNLGDTLAVRNGDEGTAVYQFEPEGEPFTDLGLNVHVHWPRPAERALPLGKRA